MKWIFRALAILMIAVGIFLMVHQLYYVKEAPMTDLLRLPYTEAVKAENDVFFAGAAAACSGILASFFAWMKDPDRKEEKQEEEGW